MFDFGNNTANSLFDNCFFKKDSIDMKMHLLNTGHLTNFCVTASLTFIIHNHSGILPDIFTNDSNPRQDVFLGRSWTLSEWTPGSARLGLPLLAMLWSLCPLRPTLTARTLPLILLTSQIPPLIGQDPDWRVIRASDWSKAGTGFGPDLGHICWHCLAWPGPSCSGSEQLLTLDNTFLYFSVKKLIKSFISSVTWKSHYLLITWQCINSYLRAHRSIHI